MVPRATKRTWRVNALAVFSAASAYTRNDPSNMWRRRTADAKASILGSRTVRVARWVALLDCQKPKTYRFPSAEPT